MTFDIPNMFDENTHTHKCRQIQMHDMHLMYLDVIYIEIKENKKPPCLDPFGW